MIRWPKNSGRAILKLFKSVQDLDVYVEDQGDEIFYTTVLSAVSSALGVTIRRVVSLGGVRNVVIEAKTYAGERKALFLIDGDLPWVRGELLENVSNLYRLECYCIENVLIRENLAASVCEEEAICQVEHARQILSFDEWRRAVILLVPLFIRFAVANKYLEAEKTVGLGYSSVVIHNEHGLPVVSADKVNAKIAEFDSLLEAALGVDEARAQIDVVSNRVKDLPDALRIVSGKSFLLPLLHFHLRVVSGTKASYEVFRYRMARKCGPDDLPDLRAAIESVM